MGKKKIIFWQNMGTFPGTMMVCVGWKDYKDVIEFLKKKKYTEWHRAMKLKPEEFKNPHCSKWELEKWTPENPCITYFLLWLPDCKEDAEHLTVLAHELVHCVSYHLKDFIDPIKENEAMAYQHTFLMKNIIKQLIGTRC